MSGFYTQEDIDDRNKHLEALGLNADDDAVTADEVKKAYHRLAKKLHPDKNTDQPQTTMAANAERFKAVSNAYGFFTNDHPELLIKPTQPSPFIPVAQDWGAYYDANAAPDNEDPEEKYDFDPSGNAAPPNTTTEDSSSSEEEDFSTPRSRPFESKSASDVLLEYFTSEKALLPHLAALKHIQEDPGSILKLFANSKREYFTETKDVDEEGRFVGSYEVEHIRVIPAGPLNALRQNLDDSQLLRELQALAQNQQFLDKIVQTDRHAQAAEILRELADQKKSIADRIQSLENRAYASDPEIKSLRQQIHEPKPTGVYTGEGHPEYEPLSSDQENTNRVISNQIETRERVVARQLSQEDPTYQMLLVRRGLANQLRTSVKTWIQTGQTPALPTDAQIKAVEKNIGTGGFFSKIFARIKDLVGWTSKNLRTGYEGLKHPLLSNPTGRGRPSSRQ